MSSREPSEFWLFYKPFPGDEYPIQLVNWARAAILADTAGRAKRAGFDRVRVFSTTTPTEFRELEVEQTDAEDRIGRIVGDAAVKAEGPVCYAGSGMPMMTVRDWAAVLKQIRSGVAVANRIFSTDWIGVPDGGLFGDVSVSHTDNEFGQLVRNRGEVAPFPRSANSLFDVDTPADLAVLKYVQGAGRLESGPRLASMLDTTVALAHAEAKARRVFYTYTRDDQELFISGRVGGADWAVLDRDTACRVRVLSEVRGLKVRAEPAWTLLGVVYDAIGMGGLTNALAGMGDAMIWDTRPFFSDQGWELSRSDRFAADLGRWDMIEHEELAELVLALEEAPMPVLTGGHSLVSGGMLAGIDAAWSRRERRRELSG